MESAFKNKKIVFFTAETIPSYAGCGRHAFQLARHIANLNADCKVVCYNYNNKLPRIEKIGGVYIQRVAYFNTNLFFKIISIPNLIRAYFFETRKCDIVIVYGRFLIAYPLIFLFANIFSKKTIFRSTLLGVDDIESIKKRSRLLWPLIKYLFSKITCYWGINSRFAEIWQSEMGESVPSIDLPQGVNLEKFFPKTEQQNAMPKEPVANNKVLQILSCGVLIERKGYQEIFQSLSRVTEPFVYKVVGQYKADKSHRSSSLEAAEMKKIYNLGKRLLADKIVFVGTTESVAEYYYSADILIHGASSEGTPNVILESMASGLPVVCRKLEGLSGSLFIHNTNCLEYSSEDELVNIINNANNNKQKLQAIGIEGYKTIKEFCSFDNTVYRLSECIK